MRLAILTSHLIQYYSPLFRELATMADVHVFFAHQATPENQANAGYGVPFEWDIDLTSGFEHSFLRNVSRKPNTSFYSGCDTPEVGARLAAFQPDALLMTGWHLKSFHQGWFAAKRAGIPVMVRGDSQIGSRQSLIRRVAKRVLYPFFLKRFDAALYVGTRSRQYYEHYGYPAARLFSSPHCVDTNFFHAKATSDAGRALRQEHRIPDQAEVALFVGRQAPFKRALDLIPALKALRDEGRDARLLVAGAGETLADLIAAAKAGEIPVTALGFVNQSALPAVYAAADVLCLPSDARETWGLVCNEAIAARTPIVVSDQVGCAPDLCDGIVGRAFPMGDTAALTKQLRDTFDAVISEAAFARMSDAYSLRAAADGVLKAAQSLAKPETRTRDESPKRV